MEITGLQLFIAAYIFNYWILFPCFTKKGTGYLRSVRASHIFFFPILLPIILGILESIK